MIDNQTIYHPRLQSDNVRIKWVDTAKALGLFLVFWGHILYGGSEVAGVINRAIYSFHMPMYFILSGYVLKPDSKTFGAYLKSKFDRVLLPSLIVYVLTLPIYFYTLDHSTATFGSILSTVFYYYGQCAYNSPIWFFFCLYEVYILAKLLRLAEADSKNLMIILIITLGLSFLFYSSGWGIFNIFGFNKCILGLFFVSFGYALKRTSYKDKEKIAGLISLPVWVVSGIILNTKISMYGMNLGNFWIFIISSIAGSLVFFALSKLMGNFERIREYAKWTIFIVSSHLVFVSAFSSLSTRLSIRGTYLFDVSSAIFVLVSLFVYRYVCKFLERHIPVVLGLKKNAKDL